MDANTGGIDVLLSTPENSPPGICAAAGGGSVAAIGTANSSPSGLVERVERYLEQFPCFLSFRVFSSQVTYLRALTYFHRDLKNISKLPLGVSAKSTGNVLKQRGLFVKNKPRAGKFPISLPLFLYLLLRRLPTLSWMPCWEITLRQDQRRFAL